MSNLPRTIIEFTDTKSPDPALAHITRQVKVNGTPVLLAEDGVEIEYGYGEITKVILTILPTEVHFTAGRGNE